MHATISTLAQGPSSSPSTHSSSSQSTLRSTWRNARMPMRSSSKISLHTCMPLRRPHIVACSSSKKNRQFLSRASLAQGRPKRSRLACAMSFRDRGTRRASLRAAPALRSVPALLRIVSCKLTRCSRLLAMLRPCAMAIHRGSASGLRSNLMPAVSSLLRVQRPICSRSLVSPNVGRGNELTMSCTSFAAVARLRKGHSCICSRPQNSDSLASLLQSRYLRSTTCSGGRRHATRWTSLA
mmetsp:Transcript_55140/g.109514  ORF Transcript_55140/g.109514 Transcript_55140/m.109514 type:complete len:239 (-) Transcript_55140:171-887(-)